MANRIVGSKVESDRFLVISKGEPTNQPIKLKVNGNEYITTGNINQGQWTYFSDLSTITERHDVQFSGIAQNPITDVMSEDMEYILGPTTNIFYINWGADDISYNGMNITTKKFSQKIYGSTTEEPWYPYSGDDLNLPKVQYKSNIMLVRTSTDRYIIFGKDIYSGDMNEIILSNANDVLSNTYMFTLGNNQWGYLYDDDTIISNSRITEPFPGTPSIEIQSTLYQEFFDSIYSGSDLFVSWSLNYNLSYSGMTISSGNFQRSFATRKEESWTGISNDLSLPKSGICGILLGCINSGGWRYLVLGRQYSALSNIITLTVTTPTFGTHTHTLNLPINQWGYFAITSLVPMNSRSSLPFIGVPVTNYTNHTEDFNVMFGSGNTFMIDWGTGSNITYNSLALSNNSFQRVYGSSTEAWSKKADDLNMPKTYDPNVVIACRNSLGQNFIVIGNVEGNGSTIRIRNTGVSSWTTSSGIPQGSWTYFTNNIINTISDRNGIPFNGSAISPVTTMGSVSTFVTGMPFIIRYDPAHWRSYTINIGGTNGVQQASHTPFNFVWDGSGNSLVMPQNCFLEGTLIKINDNLCNVNTNYDVDIYNNYFPIENLRRGDIVFTEHNYMRIARLVSSPITPSTKIVKISQHSLSHNLPFQDLYITHKHPIYFNKKRYHPLKLVSMGKAEIIETPLNKLVFNLQFEIETSIFANGVQADSLSPYLKSNYLPSEMYFDKSKFDETKVTTCEQLRAKQKIIPKITIR